MKKIVFFPYKASMWDSLESIWMAAMEDKECEVKVVVIPYYDKNSDGSLGQFHYEADLFPHNVNITHFDEYDIKAEQPDIAYIHNPYDMGNHATTVDPRYYSRKIKESSKLLVYVPYYVTSGTMGAAQALCFSYIYADYIIVQSEDIKQYFDKSVPRRKLLALGSPKLDRVVRIKKQYEEYGRLYSEEDNRLLSSWRNIANGRRIYFYNTSLNEFLLAPARYIDKMEYVINCFKNNSSACLLWRPHPLLETTIKSMAGDVYERYLRLRDTFVNSQMGIFDTSPSMDAALVISDAYIGDSSTSLVTVFGAMGKPMFFLNLMITDKVPTIEGSVVLNRNFDGTVNPKWALTNGDLLFKANEPYKYRFLVDLSKGMKNAYYYTSVFEIGDRIYVCPRCADDIVVIADDKVEKKIAIAKATEGKWNFKKSIAINNYIFLVPDMYSSLVMYNTVNDEVDYFDTFNSETICDAVSVGDCLVMLSKDSSRLYILNTVSGEFSENELGIDIESGVKMLGSDIATLDLWIVPNVAGTIVRIDMDTGSMYTYTDIPEGYDIICCIKGEKYIFNYKNNEYLRFDKNNGDISVVDLHELEGITGIDSVTFDNDEIIHKWPGFGRLSGWLPYGLSEDVFNQLPDFLSDNLRGQAFDAIDSAEAFSRIVVNADGSCGRKIHEYMIGRLEDL